MCQCQQNFGGKQCQHSADRCSPKKMGFNGGFSCSGDAEGMSCKLSCPQGIQFETPPAAAYKCSFEMGLFVPAKTPKCVYGWEIKFSKKKIMRIFYFRRRCSGDFSFWSWFVRSWVKKKICVKKNFFKIHYSSANLHARLSKRWKLYFPQLMPMPAEFQRPAMSILDRSLFREEHPLQRRIQL